MLMSLGGQPGTGAYAAFISYAYLYSGVPYPDAIGIWRITPSGRLPVGRAGLGALDHRTRLYVIVGSDASGKYYDEVISAAVDLGHP